MLYDPRWGWHAAAELGGHVTAPRPIGVRRRMSRRICLGRRRSAQGEANVVLANAGTHTPRLLV
jgi:hypothetical protein